MSALFRNITVIAFFLFFIFSCGNPVVDFGEGSYEPKIVIEGYLFPNSKVQNIKIGRNFPLNTTIDSNQLFIKDANVKIMNLNNNLVYSLTFNPTLNSYEYNGNDLKVDYGKSYKLIVDATIEGTKVSANSTTIIPQKGLEINRSQCILDSMFYRALDNSGNLKHFKVNFNLSPGTEFYIVSVTALDANLKTFVYENPFMPFKDTTRIKQGLDYLKYQYIWFQNISKTGTSLEKEIDWLNIWFYSSFQLIVYAGDKNYKDFLLTHQFVQEMDGNLHEPRFHIEGDGIGVFGSAIADTAYFKVLKK